MTCRTFTPIRVFNYLNLSDSAPYANIQCC